MSAETKTLTRVLGKISASNFLYRLTGFRELDLRLGQHTHMLPHAGNIFLEMIPISCQQNQRGTEIVKTHQKFCITLIKLAHNALKGLQSEIPKSNNKCSEID